jgi:K+-sensing histidine kinase KdpD
VLRARGAILRDVTVHFDERTPAIPPPAGGVSPRRQQVGAVVALCGLPAVALALIRHRDDVLLTTPVLLMLAVVLTVALVGGMRPALPAAVLGFLLLNFVFTEPYGTFEVHHFDQGLALVMYTATAVAVSVVVGVAARRHSAAVRAAAEAAALAAVAGAGGADVQAVLERIRAAFAMPYAALVVAGGRGAALIEAGCRNGAEPELRVRAGDGVDLLVAGRTLYADDRRVLRGFAQAAAASAERSRHARQAAEAERLASIDQLRTALLAGVGHDLRTPLSGIKAAVSSLRADDVQWTTSQRDELLDVVESSADRLDALVANLLATSRLDAGALSVDIAPVDVEEIVGRGVSGLGGNERVLIEIPAGLPPAATDLGLAERVIANLTDNALRHSGKGSNVLITASARAGQVTVSIVDTGPGVSAGGRAALFRPFQRLGDRSPGGLGLGLSVAHGFTEAMGGSLEPAETPGGGLTMHIRLPAAGIDA